MKKWRVRLLLSLLVSVVVAGCSLGDPLLSRSDGVSAMLPPDQVSVVSRSYDGQFTFETLHTVDLEITVALYEPDPAPGGSVLRSVDPGTVPVIVTISNSRGNQVYRGRIGGAGTLNTALLVPSAPDDMTLTLTAPGFDTRSVRIRDLRQYSGIQRSMGMVRSGIAAQSGVPADSDGDGVPDIHDAFPFDAAASFVHTIPAEGVLTIAFEDLFGRANAGDADYNDFLAQYRIQEVSASDGGIVRIRVDALARVKLAGYDHRFGIRMDSFEGSATLSGRYVDNRGAVRDLGPRIVTSPVEIELFENSRYAVHKESWFELAFDRVQYRNPDLETDPLSAPPYNPYLLVRNTGHDIHLIGGKSITGSINPGDPFVDGDGFPWALLVPADWRHPDEGQRIEIPYPRFTLWRESSGMEHSDWYNHYFDPYVPDPDNNPPYPVTGPTQSPRFRAYTSSDQYYQLEIDTPDGQRDPDGDDVYFRSTALPSYFSLDEATGLVTILGDPSFSGPEPAEVVIEFWSEDEHGADTRVESYVVTFIIGSS